MKRIGILAFTLAFTGAVTPGPMLALVIGQTLARGWTATGFILIGHALIELLFVVLLATGFAAHLRRPRVSSTLSLIGGGVLVWMGVAILMGARQESLAASAGESVGSWFGLIVAGVGVSLSNPYFTSWWVTVGTGQIATLRLRLRRDFAIFLIGHEMGDLVWYGMVTMVLVAGRSWLSDGVYQGLLLVCGAIIAALGVLFLVVGGRRLAGAKVRAA